MRATLHVLVMTVDRCCRFLDTLPPQAVWIVRWGCRETVRNALLDTDGIPWWVIRTHGKRRRDFPELLRRPEYDHAAVIRFDRPVASHAVLLAVSARPETTHSGHTHAG
jgi:hypothetical protein